MRETLEQRAEQFDRDEFGHHGEPCSRYAFAAAFARKLLEEAAQLAEANAGLCSSCTDLAESIRELAR